jgi:hypothetical protein
LKLSANRSEAKSDWRLRVFAEELTLTLPKGKDAAFDAAAEKA